MVLAGQQASDAAARRFAHLGLGVVCVKCEFPVHVIEVQALAQMLALEQLRIRAVQPSGNLCERSLVEPLFIGPGGTPRALAHQRRMVSSSTSAG